MHFYSFKVYPGVRRVNWFFAMFNVYLLENCVLYWKSNSILVEATGKENITGQAPSTSHSRIVFKDLLNVSLFRIDTTDFADHVRHYNVLPPFNFTSVVFPFAKEFKHYIFVISWCIDIHIGISVMFNKLHAYYNDFNVCRYSFIQARTHEFVWRGWGWNIIYPFIRL